MPNEPYDYRKYDQVWSRVNPGENPYPEVRQESNVYPPVEKEETCGAILREELRHARELLKLLENSLA